MDDFVENNAIPDMLGNNSLRFVVEFIADLPHPTHD